MAYWNYNIPDLLKELNTLRSVLVKGITEINETSIKANLVKNRFGTEEIDLKETWLRNILVFQLRDVEVLPVHLSLSFLE